MRRFYSVFRTTVLNIAAVIGGLCIVVFCLSVILGVQALNVMSGSMEPDIPTGSLILTKPIAAAEVQVGDVITTARVKGDGLITHRVTAIEPVEDHPGVYTMRMQGDANASEDPNPYTVSEVGRYLLHIPGLGLVATLIKTRMGVLLGIAIVALFVLLFIFPGQTRERDGAEPAERDASEPSRAPRGAA